MYKIDDEFRPPGRVFMKATRENPGTALVPRGSAITTSLDAKASGVKFRHDVIHEKTIEAVITDYRNGDSRNSSGRDVVDGSNMLKYSVPTRDRDTSDLQQITRNKRLSTEVLGSTLETTKTSQKAPDGHRRHVTHIVRKVTTLSRAEEREQANNMIKFSNDKRTIELGFSSTQALEPKRVKVAKLSIKISEKFSMMRLRYNRAPTTSKPNLNVIAMKTKVCRMLLVCVRLAGMDT